VCETLAPFVWRLCHYDSLCSLCFFFTPSKTTASVLTVACPALPALPFPQLLFWLSYYDSCQPKGAATMWPISHKRVKVRADELLQ